MSTMIEEHFFADRAGLLAGLQQHIEASLKSALVARQKASIALSGGSTPGPLYEQLSNSELDWSKVDVTLSDERFVPSDHSDSNEAMIGRTLLKGAAASARFTPLMRAVDSPAEAAKISGAALAEIAQPLDFLLLGMGDDMHTASLFPDAPELSAALDMHSGERCMVLKPPASPHPRLSLTLPALLNSREIALLITGDAKREALARALASDSPQTAPVAAILQQNNVPVHIYWSP